jgi:sulfite reductase beta subunit-like hemoprotein
VALREVIERFGVNPIATPGQDLLLADVAKEDRAALEALLRAHAWRCRRPSRPSRAP